MNLSISRLAELTQMDRRAISAKLADLQSTDGPKGARLYNSATALRLLLCLGASGEKLDAQQERALLDRERRKQLEMTNAKAEGKLIDADEVTATWTHHILIAKGRLLSIPNRLAPMLVSMSDMRKIETTIRDEIFQALEELATERSE